MNTITLSGTIQFDPQNCTKKHILQGTWKRLALIRFNENITEYYAWFIKKRYRLILNRPLRGAHVSFINDRELATNGMWNEVKANWDGKSINITLSVDVKSDGKHWWLVMPEKYRTELHSIRAELGLARPHWGLHMSIGYANEKYINHSHYILREMKRKTS